MNLLIKYTIHFLLYGLVWFILYSLPIFSGESLLITIQKAVKFGPDEEKPKRLEKDINHDEVIDALSKAFKP
jgi:hypothetical protein